MVFAMCRLLDPYTPGGEPFHMAVALCLFLETINTRIDFVLILKRTHTPLRPFGDFTTSRCVLARAPPDHSYRDLGFLHSRCDQFSLTLAESCWGGRSPVIASPRVSPPSEALCHPRPDSSSLKIVIVHETPPAILLLQSLFKQRYHGPFVPGALYSDNRRLRSRESPSPKQVEVAFKPLRMISPSRTLPGPGLGPSPQDRHRPSDASSDLALAVAFQGALSRTIRSWRRSCDYRRLRSCTGGSRLQGVPPFHSEWFRFKGVPFSKWMGFTTRGSPPLYSECDSPSPSE